MEEQLKALLDYVQSDRRICPMPPEWNELWNMLPNRMRVGGSWDPPPPLILAAWWDTPYLAKILRLQEHIRYAEAHGVLEEVDNYLRSLEPEQWFYG